MVGSPERTEPYLIGRDVTEQKQLQTLRAQLIDSEAAALSIAEELTYDQVEGAQLAVVSHELRTPL